MADPRVTVLVPTWRAPHTIGGAVRSALRQTVSELEVLIVGDGVDDETRRAVRELCEADRRVRFLDLPKAEHRGECNRHLGVIEARAPYIAYLADDDLLLPRHVENVLGMLVDAELAQSANGFIAADDRLVLWPTDLGDPQWVHWHLLDPPRNRVSITGTAHRRDAYLELDPGWAHDPAMRWSDLPLWRQFFRRPGFVGKTHHEVTTLQFPSAARRTMSQESSLEQFARWASFIERDDAHEALQRMAQEAAGRQLIELSARSTDLELELRSATETLREQLDSARHEIATLRAEALAVTNTLSWRVTAPLRAMRRLSAGRRGSERQ